VTHWVEDCSPTDGQFLPPFDHGTSISVPAGQDAKIHHLACLAKEGARDVAICRKLVEERTLLLAEEPSSLAVDRAPVVKANRLNVLTLRSFSSLTRRRSIKQRHLKPLDFL
jgi:hypothetical protein